MAEETESPDRDQNKVDSDANPDSNRDKTLLEMIVDGDLEGKKPIDIFNEHQEKIKEIIESRFERKNDLEFLLGTYRTTNNDTRHPPFRLHSNPNDLHLKIWDWIILARGLLRTYREQHDYAYSELEGTGDSIKREQYPIRDEEIVISQIESLIAQRAIKDNKICAIGDFSEPVKVADERNIGGYSILENNQIMAIVPDQIKEWKESIENIDFWLLRDEDAKKIHHVMKEDRHKESIDALLEAFQGGKPHSYAAHVLSVDDEESQRTKVQRFAEEQNLHCEDAETAAGAIKKVEEYKFGTVFLDFDLKDPDGLNGVLLAKKIQDIYEKKNYPPNSTNFIILSGVPDEEMKAQSDFSVLGELNYVHIRKHESNTDELIRQAIKAIPQDGAVIVKDSLKGKAYRIVKALADKNYIATRNPNVSWEGDIKVLDITNMEPKEKDELIKIIDRSKIKESGKTNEIDRIGDIVNYMSKPHFKFIGYEKIPVLVDDIIRTRRTDSVLSVFVGNREINSLPREQAIREIQRTNPAYSQYDIRSVLEKHAFHTYLKEWPIIERVMGGFGIDFYKAMINRAVPEDAKLPEERILKKIIEKTFQGPEEMEDGIFNASEIGKIKESVERQLELEEDNKRKTWREIKDYIRNGYGIGRNHMEKIDLSQIIDEDVLQPAKANQLRDKVRAEMKLQLRSVLEQEKAIDEIGIEKLIIREETKMETPGRNHIVHIKTRYLGEDMTDSIAKLFDKRKDKKTKESEFNKEIKAAVYFSRWGLYEAKQFRAEKDPDYNLIAMSMWGEKNLMDVVEQLHNRRKEIRTKFNRDAISAKLDGLYDSLMRRIARTQVFGTSDTLKSIAEKGFSNTNAAKQKYDNRLLDMIGHFRSGSDHLEDEELFMKSDQQTSTSFCRLFEKTEDNDLISEFKIAAERIVENTDTFTSYLASLKNSSIYVDSVLRNFFAKDVLRTVTKIDYGVVRYMPRQFDVCNPFVIGDFNSISEFKKYAKVNFFEFEIAIEDYKWSMHEKTAVKLKNIATNEFRNNKMFPPNVASCFNSIASEIDEKENRNLNQIVTIAENKINQYEGSEREVMELYAKSIGEFIKNIPRTKKSREQLTKGMSILYDKKNAPFIEKIQGEVIPNIREDIRNHFNIEHEEEDKYLLLKVLSTYNNIEDVQRNMGDGVALELREIYLRTDDIFEQYWETLLPVAAYRASVCARAFIEYLDDPEMTGGNSLHYTRTIVNNYHNFMEEFVLLYQTKIGKDDLHTKEGLESLCDMKDGVKKLTDLVNSAIDKYAEKINVREKQEK